MRNWHIKNEHCYARTRHTVNELKIQASLLIKALRSDQIEIVNLALQRCRQYPPLLALSNPLFEVTCQPLKRKTALNIIAFEQGWDNWDALTKRYDTRWYPTHSPFTLNWYSQYQDAQVCQQETKGFLLPYQNQYFVCTHEYIEWLGLDAKDENWQKIAFDAAQPKNESALAQLTLKLKSAKIHST